jgi:hypothetical protein
MHKYLIPSCNKRRGLFGDWLLQPNLAKRPLAANCETLFSVQLGIRTPNKKQPQRHRDTESKEEQMKETMVVALSLD